MTTQLAGKIQQKKSTILRILILILSGTAILGALLLPLASRPTSYQIQLGSVATQDYQALKNISYVSDVLTNQKIATIEASVSNVYLPVDPAIARHQIDRLRKSLDYINLIRLDNITEIAQKIEDLDQLDDITLSKEEASQLLALNDIDWQSIQRESISVLEQVMRASIRDTQVSEAQTRIPSLISYTFSEENASIIEALTTPFVVPNSLFSKEATDLAVQEAVKLIDPIEKSYAIGEIIVRRGQIIDETAYEALMKMNLISPTNQGEEVIAATIFTATLILIVGIFFNKRRLSNDSIKQLLVLSVTFLFFLFFAKFLIPNRTIIPYLFPVAGFTFVISALFGFETSLVLTLILSCFISYETSDFFTLVIYYLLPSLSGALILGQGRRISTFFAAGGLTGIIGASLVFAIRLIDGSTDWIGLLTLVLASLFNGMASASIGLLFQYLISQLLGITTAIQLLEIARPDHPLLQFILKNSPGSYQHSLQVSNLAEQAAKEIGADQLLTRVGAIYHDAGKAMNPSFFIENQVTGQINSHDDLDPYVSSATVIQHVGDGVELARKYRLPPRIIDFMLEHHGTMMTRYFYVKAVEQNDNQVEKVNEADFRYPGPIPQSKETALLMLADGCEAKARAEKPQSKEELRSIVQKVIEFCQKEGQLESTDLTLHDLNIIQNSFTNTLLNTYHPRIKYPEIKK
jgi:putative nucleotidyltransferase with HDIG domain